ncbi:MAG TPA: hypothetical protein VF258_02685 [Luteolibacter sp.]
MSVSFFPQIILRFSLCLGMVLFASSLGEAAPAGGGVASIQMIAFAYNGSERKVTIADVKGTLMLDKPVELPINQCSTAISVTSRDLVFTLTNEGDKELAVGKERSVKSVSLALPRTGRDFILVFLPLPADQSASYRVHAVELPAEKFKGGSFAFLNYSNSEIGCVIDNERSVVASGKAGIVTPSAKEGMIFAACFEKTEAAWPERPFFSGRIPIQGSVRTLVLMSRDSINGRMGFRAVADFVGR